MHKVLFLVAPVLLFASCGTINQVTRADQYSRLYEERPLTLLVMPPINNSSHVEAKDLLYTSISKPLIEAGYYVISPNLAMDVLKNESAYDAEYFVDGDLKMFNKAVGADAVIFSVIETWAKRGFGIDTKIRYIIKSAYTNEVLFEKSCDLYLSLQVRSGNYSIIGQLVDLAASAIVTAATDQIVAARKANAYIFIDIPYGKYNPQFDKDRNLSASPKDITATIQ